MRLIKPSVEILKPSPELRPTERMLRMIEIAGRTCYKSEDKITDDSAKAFVDMLIAKGHTAMLEHGTVYLCIPVCDYTKETCDLLAHNPYSFWAEHYRGKDSDLYISTNYRVLLENNLLHALKYQIAEEDFIADAFSQWLDFFILRCASSAHPQARELALDLQRQFIDEGYITDSEISNDYD